MTTEKQYRQSYRWLISCKRQQWGAQSAGQEINTRTTFYWYDILENEDKSQQTQRIVLPTLVESRRPNSGKTELIYMMETEQDMVLMTCLLHVLWTSVSSCRYTLTWLDPVCSLKMPQHYSVPVSVAEIHLCINCLMSVCFQK